jgi:stage V sporulation protein G
MNITDVKVFLRPTEPLKAFANIVFDDAFIIKNIKIIEGKNGLFIAMPSQRVKNGEYKDIAHPLNTDTRMQIEKRILDEYNEALKNPTANEEES